MSNVLKPELRLGYLVLLLTSYWPLLSHMATSSGMGGWEM